MIISEINLKEISRQLSSLPLDPLNISQPLVVWDPKSKSSKIIRFYPKNSDSILKHGEVVGVTVPDLEGEVQIGEDKYRWEMYPKNNLLTELIYSIHDFKRRKDIVEKLLDRLKSFYKKDLVFEDLDPNCVLLWKQDGSKEYEPILTGQGSLKQSIGNKDSATAQTLREFIKLIFFIFTIQILPMSQEEVKTLYSKWDILGKEEEELGTDPFTEEEIIKPQDFWSIRNGLAVYPTLLSSKSINLLVNTYLSNINFDAVEDLIKNDLDSK